MPRGDPVENRRQFPMAVCAMIEGKGICKSFGNRVILSDASFLIPEGQIVGHSGKSGIGKTTLARIMCGIIPPDSGNIYRNGAPLWVNNTYKRTEGLTIQMVSQHPFSSLDPRQKLISGFRELIHYHHFASDGKETDTLIENIAREVGLTREILQQFPHQISGGEAQRTVIARCLLFKPELLILDEATSMLDVSTQANIIGLVKRMQTAQGRSILLISHADDLVKATCDRIYEIDHTKFRLLPSDLEEQKEI